MRISVIGTGYLGAVHAACMASLGHEVVGYDTDPAKVEALSRGISPRSRSSTRWPRCVRWPTPTSSRSARRWAKTSGSVVDS
jgi:ketopantoate reductase